MVVCWKRPSVYMSRQWIWYLMWDTVEYCSWTGDNGWSLTSSWRAWHSAVRVAEPQPDLLMYCQRPQVLVCTLYLISTFRLHPVNELTEIIVTVELHTSSTDWSFMILRYFATAALQNLHRHCKQSNHGQKHSSYHIPPPLLNGTMHTIAGACLHTSIILYAPYHTLGLNNTTSVTLQEVTVWSGRTGNLWRRGER